VAAIEEAKGGSWKQIGRLEMGSWRNFDQESRPPNPGTPSYPRLHSLVLFTQTRPSLAIMQGEWPSCRTHPPWENSVNYGVSYRLLTGWDELAKNHVRGCRGRLGGILTLEWFLGILGVPVICGVARACQVTSCHKIALTWFVAGIRFSWSLWSALHLASCIDLRLELEECFGAT